MTVLYRRVEGPVDVTMGEHPDLNMCVCPHYGSQSRIEGLTQWPIQPDIAKCSQAPVRPTGASSCPARALA